MFTISPICFLLVCFCVIAVSANEGDKFIGGIVAQDGSDSELSNNRYKRKGRKHTLDEVLFGKDATNFTLREDRCHHHVEIAWTSEVGSSIYSTPVITDFFNDGRKQIVASTYAHYLEVMDAATGADIEGWPYVHHDIASHASPIVTDIDRDGAKEILYATATGELLFFTGGAEVNSSRTIKIPPLQVQKDWYKTVSKADDVAAGTIRREEAARAPLIAGEHEVSGDEGHSDGLYGAAGHRSGASSGKPRPLKGGIKLRGNDLTILEQLDVNAMPPLAKVPMTASQRHRMDRLSGGDVDTANLPPSRVSHRVRHFDDKPHQNPAERLRNALDDASGIRGQALNQRDSSGLIDSVKVPTDRRAEVHGADLEGAHRAPIAEVGNIDPKVDAQLNPVGSSTGYAPPSLDDHIRSNRALLPEQEAEMEGGGIKEAGARSHLTPQQRFDLGAARAVPVRHSPWQDEHVIDDGLGIQGAVPLPPRSGRQILQADDVQEVEEDDSAFEGMSDEELRAFAEGGGSDGGAYAGMDDMYDDIYGEAVDNYERDKAAMRERHELGTDGRLSQEAAVSRDLVFGRNEDVPPPAGRSPFEDYTTPNRDPSSPRYAPAFHYPTYLHPPEGFLYVDAHILGTPVVIDLDRDGHLDIVVAVSYYFDSDSNSAPLDVDPDNYVAGSLSVYDGVTGALKWSVQLDLTTNHVQFRAYIYGSPTVVDLDGDGKLDVAVATSQGFIYVFDSEGKLRRNFPKFMAEIQGGIATGDVNEDGIIDMCTVDFHSHVLCFDSDAKDLWEAVIVDVSAQAPSIGDVNGDGAPDVVVASASGLIFAFDGHTGQTLSGFPVRTRGPIYAPVVLVSLQETLRSPSALPIPPMALPLLRRQGLRLPTLKVTHPGLHIVVPSHDGWIYIVDGMKGCVDKIDLGEHSYAMVLVDDLSGAGNVDLLVSTMSGVVYSLATAIPFHPLKRWAAQTQAGNGFTAQEGYMGVYILPSTRHALERAHGQMIKLFFEIVDDRKFGQHMVRRKYDVVIAVGDDPMPTLTKTYHAAGLYVELIKLPTVPAASSVNLRMTNEFGQIYSDSTAVFSNLHATSYIKWFILAPFVLTLLLLSVVPHDSNEGGLQSVLYRHLTDEDAFAIVLSRLHQEATYDSAFEDYEHYEPREQEEDYPDEDPDDRGPRLHLHGGGTSV